ncbi:MAG: hypothetical protein M5U01_27550 [Ardenticatenaceae bacterium]|nr:hypothetical protein [Ardenticatenaceae bacterium]HBY94554.1 hypothetical protein [Chloroflexota bacterium]
MSQLEENLAFRLGQLEKTLEAYRALHVAELEEIAHALAALRPNVEALLTAAAPPGQPVPGKARPTIETGDSAR